MNLFMQSYPFGYLLVYIKEGIHLFLFFSPFIALNFDDDNNDD